MDSNNEKSLNMAVEQDAKLEQKESRAGNDLESLITHDSVFGQITTEGPNYRSVTLLGTIALMIKTQIGLGVLSIPIVFDALGMVPGVICLIIIAVITSWSDYVVGIFKLNHPEVYSIDDVGGKLAGRVGYWVLGVAFCLYWICVAGSGMLGISISLNALSSHGTCTAAFVAVGAVIAFCLSSIQTLSKIGILCWVGLTCILISIFTLTVAVGVQDRPAAAPQDVPWHSDYKITNPDVTPASALAAISSLVFAYAGTPAFFSIVAEMRDPRKYTKALITCQTVVTVTYITIGIVVYYFCGSYVASPALGSAGALMKKVCYGIALPGLIMTTTLVTHIAAKYVFVHLLRNSIHLSRNTPQHWMVWLSCTFGIVLIAYIIASAVPVFGGLVSLVGALLGTLMSFQPMGAMWLYDNWSKPRTLRWRFMVAWSIFVIVAGTFLMIGGTYGSIVGIIDSYNESGGTAAWSCADNSGSK